MVALASCERNMEREIKDRRRTTRVFGRPGGGRGGGGAIAKQRRHAWMLFGFNIGYLTYLGTYSLPGALG